MWRRVDLARSAHPRIAILHIPKTAGTSLLTLARRNVRRAQLFTHYPPDDAPPPPAERLTAGVLIGHYFAGYERRFFDNCERIVFLREPAARLESQLEYERRYFLRRTESPFHAWFRAGGAPVDFVEHSRFWYLDNAAVRMLSGVGDGVPFGELSDGHLQTASEALSAFEFVGLQATFAGDVAGLMKRWGWRGRVPRVNAAPRPSRFSDADRDRLRPYNALDEQLYERAVSLRE